MRSLGRCSLPIELLAIAVVSACGEGASPDPAKPDIRVEAERGRAECVVSKGLVFCRGDGSRGILGTGSVIEHSDRFHRIEPIRTASSLALSLSAVFACAVVSNEVWCWGDNVSGALGRLEAVRYDGGPESIARAQRVGMLPPSQQVALGQVHACSLSTSGAVHCWGANSTGQVLDPRVEPRLEVVPPVLVPLPARAAQLALGWDQSCALLTNNDVVCWGGSVPGVAGPGPAYAPTVVARDAIGLPRVAHERTCVTTRTGEVCWLHADLEISRRYFEPYVSRAR